MLDYRSLPIGENAPAVINAVVEIPKGSTNKYEYDPQLRVFRLDRVLHSAVYYPATGERSSTWSMTKALTRKS